MRVREFVPLVDTLTQVHTSLVSELSFLIWSCTPHFSDPFFDVLPLIALLLRIIPVLQVALAQLLHRLLVWLLHCLLSHYLSIPPLEVL